MAWGNSANVTTVHLGSATDDPSQARVELYNALVELTAVINGRGASNGVASLDSNSLVPSTQLPDTFTTGLTNNLILDPDTGRVAVQDIINLNAQTVSELNARTSIEGDVAYCSNGDAGSPCVAVYDGTAWQVVSLGSNISAT